MNTINDVHQQFAAYFDSPILKPFAYLLSKKLKEGNICIALSEATLSEELRPTNYNINPKILAQLANEPLVCDGITAKQPFVIYKNKMYLQRYFHYETLILNRLQKFVQSEGETFTLRLAHLQAHKQFIQQLFTTPITNKAQVDWQMVAAITALLNNFSIITGGPGTGKTTTVAKILAVLFTIQPAMQVALAAPTGKAAARMAESLKAANIPVSDLIKQKFETLVPSTIHRLLKAKKGTHHFKHNNENPLPVDVVIVDESSMIDVALFAKLLDAIGPNTRLVLLGDKDQLASVEAGSLFGDLCIALPTNNIFDAERLAIINSFITHPIHTIDPILAVPYNPHPLFEHIIELQYSHRFDSQAGIGKLSQAIIKNDTAVLLNFFTTKPNDTVTIDTTYNDIIFNTFIQNYTAYILEKDIKLALQKLNKVRVLCAVRQGVHGLYTINNKIENWLQAQKYINTAEEFYEHRPIIITSNNYETGLYNGDIGIIRKNENEVLMAWFETSAGEIISVLPGYINQAETVFAMTIHKSQGSEFEEVLVILPDTENVQILTRELLYTGVTRAKKHITIQSTKQVLLNTAEARVTRASGINERFITQ